MAYTVKYNGYDVLCSTVEDVKALLANDEAKPVYTAPTRPPIARPVTNGSGMGALISKLNQGQKDLVRAVSDGGTIARDKLMQILGVSDHRDFAGLLIGITKSAAGSQVVSPIEKVEQRLNGNGPRVYHYKIKDSVKTEVKAALFK